MSYNFSVPAIFWWQVMDQYLLQHPQILNLPGNPLHMTSEQTSGPESFIFVTLDPADCVQDEAQASAVVCLHLDGSRLAVHPSFRLQDADIDAEPTPDLSRAERDACFTRPPPCESTLRPGPRGK